MAYIPVIAAREQADIVHHGNAGGEELDGSAEQVLPGVPIQGREVRAVVLVGCSDVLVLVRVVVEFEIGSAAQLLRHLPMSAHPGFQNSIHLETFEIRKPQRHVHALHASGAACGHAQIEMII